MAEPAERFSFQPLERRGVLLGLRPSQLVAIGAGLLLGVVGRGRLGTAGAALVVLIGAVGGLWTRDGEPLVTRLAAAVAFAARRPAAARLSPAPLDGLGASRPRSGGRVAPPRATGAAGVEIDETRFGPTGEECALVRDRRAGRVAAVVPVGGPGLSLLDPTAQLGCLEGWRRVLGALDRPGGPIRRLQWIERCAQGVAIHDLLPPVRPTDRDEDPRRSYHRLAEEAGPVLQTHATWVVVAVDGRRPDPAEELLREVRLLDGQLRQAGLDPAPPVSATTLHELLGGGGRRPWPMAWREHWGHLECDDALHSTFWVADWPRVDVPPDFLSPLLLGPGRRTLSVVMAPVGGERALREIRAARTADLADEELRSRAGFLPSTRRAREAAGVTRREAELVDGHSEFRFSGYLTVSAEDPAGLAAACAEAEHLAQSARIELRRLYGRQAEAYTWTLPLARGVR